MAQENASNFAFQQPLKNIKGSIGYTAPSFSPGQVGAVNGGYNFDLPLATVAAFNNAALTYSQANTQNAQGFLNNSIARSQTNVSNQSKASSNLASQSLNMINERFKKQQKTIDWVARTSMVMPKRGFGCFITTAICEMEGKADDCEELQTFRHFRDSYLSNAEGGREQIAEYYNVAPEITAAIDKLHNREIIYAFLRDAFLHEAMARIELGDMEGARHVYTAMFNVAKVIAGV